MTLPRTIDHSTLVSGKLRRGFRLALLTPGWSLMLAAAVSAGEPLLNCYEPVPGGWHIRLNNGACTQPDQQSVIGVVPPGAAPRLYRRPLYPPADREMVYTSQ